MTAWIMRFAQNCKHKKSERLAGPLTTSETDKAVHWWVKREQESNMGTEKFKQDQLSLNLQKNSEGVYECRGRIQGSYPVYLAPNTVLSEKLTQDAHVLTLQEGVGLTMTYIRRDYWVPRLRRLTKKVIRGCFGCKRFQATAFENPPPVNLPVERTAGSVPFQVVGVDYAGPISYKASSKRETGKAYFLLFAFILTRTIHLELLSDQTTKGFIKSFKQFITKKGEAPKGEL